MLPVGWYFSDSHCLELMVLLLTQYSNTFAVTYMKKLIYSALKIHPYKVNHHSVMPSIHFSHFALHCPAGILFLLFLLFQHIYHNHTSHYFSSNPHFCSLFTSLFPHSYSPKLSWTLLPIHVPWSSTISSSLNSHLFFYLIFPLPSPSFSLQSNTAWGFLPSNLTFYPSSTPSVCVLPSLIHL